MLGWHPYLARQRYPFNRVLFYNKPAILCLMYWQQSLSACWPPHPSVDMGYQSIYQIGFEDQGDFSLENSSLTKPPFYFFLFIQ